MILKILSRTEEQILEIKQEKNYFQAQQKSKKNTTCLKIKLILFCFFSFLLMAFFSYYISCFCAVYKNTQLILINDILISFALSLLYQFAINLLPGMLRIPALRDNKGNKGVYIK